VAAPDVILSQVLPLSMMVALFAPKLQPLVLSLATRLLSDGGCYGIERRRIASRCWIIQPESGDGGLSAQA
jgi:hypothetical protein